MTHALAHANKGISNASRSRAHAPRTNDAEPGASPSPVSINPPSTAHRAQHSFEYVLLPSKHTGSNVTSRQLVRHASKTRSTSSIFTGVRTDVTGDASIDTGGSLDASSRGATRARMDRMAKIAVANAPIRSSARVVTHLECDGSGPSWYSFTNYNSSVWDTLGFFLLTESAQQSIFQRHIATRRTPDGRRPTDDRRRDRSYII